jgi:hypothetical protein
LMVVLGSAREIVVALLVLRKVLRTTGVLLAVGRRSVFQM